MWLALYNGAQKVATQAFGSQLRRNATSGLIMTCVNVVVQLAAYPIYLHYLGYEKYGVWLILAVILAFIQMGGNLGIEPAVIKLVAEEHGRGNTQGIQSYVMMAIAALTLSGTIGLVFILCFKVQIIHAFKLSGANADLASWLLPYVGVLCVYVFIVRALNATVSGLGRMDLFNYANTVSRIVVLIVATLLLYIGRGIESLLIGYIASYVLLHIISLIFIRRIVQIRILRIANWSSQRFRRLLQFGGTVFGSKLIAMLISPFNKLMLARYAGVAVIPVYDLAFSGAMVIRGPIEIAIRAIMPEVSRLSRVGTSPAQKRIKNIIRRSMKLLLLTSVPICCFLVLLAEPLLKIWLRGKYLETIPMAFRIMLIGVFINLLCAPAYHTLMGLGKVRYCLLSTMIIGGANVVMVLSFFLLTGSISVNKIGFGLIVAFSIATVYLIYTLRRELKSESNQREDS
ncbi:MAG: oligosaccharide flippase family protein [Desulfobacteraceae bacterium]|nr:oligosaccharide flippase family protein [Desulfobacteraceae bacterium]